MSDTRLPRAIYLAGLPRSGTTWSGKALAAAAHTSMVDEPFNPEFHPEARDFDMQYIPRSARDTRFEKMLRKAAREDIYSRSSTYLPYRINTALPGARRPSEQVIIKDVHTLLALESVAAAIEPKIIVILRHPGAVAASWKRLGLKGDFHPQKERLLEQDRLINDHLQQFQEHMLASDDFYFNVGVYWGAVYYTIQQQAAKNGCGSCIFVTHEHLCDDPLGNFTSLFESVGLGMTKRAEAMLSKGDSKYESEKWKKEVSDQNMAAVVEGIRPFGIFERFYSEGA